MNSNYNIINLIIILNLLYIHYYSITSNLINILKYILTFIIIIIINIYIDPIIF
eukprot:UN13905